MFSDGFHATVLVFFIFYVQSRYIRRATNYYTVTAGTNCSWRLRSTYKYTVANPIVSFKAWKCAALLLDARRTFRLPPPLPCPPASASPGEGGRRKRRRMPNQLNVGICARLLLPFLNATMVSSVIRWWRKVRPWPSGETGAGVHAFCYTRNAKGL